MAWADPNAGLEYRDLLERGYGCAAPRCVELADCLLDGRPYCWEHVLELIEWLCVEPHYRREIPHPFESVFSSGGSLRRARRSS